MWKYSNIHFVLLLYFILNGMCDEQHQFQHRAHTPSKHIENEHRSIPPLDPLESDHDFYAEINAVFDRQYTMTVSVNNGRSFIYSKAVDPVSTFTSFFLFVQMLIWLNPNVLQYMFSTDGNLFFTFSLSLLYGAILNYVTEKQCYYHFSVLIFGMLL